MENVSYLSKQKLIMEGLDSMKLRIEKSVVDLKSVSRVYAKQFGFVTDKVRGSASILMLPNGKMFKFSYAHHIQAAKGYFEEIGVRISGWDALKRLLSAGLVQVSLTNYSMVIVYSKAVTAKQMKSLRRLVVMRGYVADDIEVDGANYKSLVREISKSSDVKKSIDLKSFSRILSKKYSVVPSNTASGILLILPNGKIFKVRRHGEAARYYFSEMGEDVKEYDALEQIMRIGVIRFSTFMGEIIITYSKAVTSAQRKVMRNIIVYGGYDRDNIEGDGVNVESLIRELSKSEDVPKFWRKIGLGRLWYNPDQGVRTWEEIPETERKNLSRMMNSQQGYANKNPPQDAKSLRDWRGFSSRRVHGKKQGNKEGHYTKPEQYANMLNRRSYRKKSHELGKATTRKRKKLFIVQLKQMDGYDKIGGVRGIWRTVLGRRVFLQYNPTTKRLEGGSSAFKRMYDKDGNGTGKITGESFDKPEKERVSRKKKKGTFTLSDVKNIPSYDKFNKERGMWKEHNGHQVFFRYLKSTKMFESIDEAVHNTGVHTRSSADNENWRGQGSRKVRVSISKNMWDTSNISQMKQAWNDNYREGDMVSKVSVVPVISNKKSWGGAAGEELGGYYSPMDRAVVLSHNVSEDQIPSLVTHEIAHVKWRAKDSTKTNEWVKRVKKMNPPITPYVRKWQLVGRDGIAHYKTKLEQLDKAITFGQHDKLTIKALRKAKGRVIKKIEELEGMDEYELESMDESIGNETHSEYLAYQYSKTVRSSESTENRYNLEAIKQLDVIYKEVFGDV